MPLWTSKGALFRIEVPLWTSKGDLFRNEAPLKARLFRPETPLRSQSRLSFAYGLAGAPMNVAGAPLSH